MQNIKIDTTTYDDFIVLNKANNPVVGLVDGDFTKILYDPNGDERANTSGGVDVMIEELGNGAYRVNFTPDKLGNWILVVYNSTHFPWGKAQTYYCVSENFESIIELIKRVLGLTQENYRLFDAEYNTINRQRVLTSGTIKIYPTANDVDNDTNAIAEYEITAEFNKYADMTSYKVKKI